MPYIEQIAREDLDPAIEQLVEVLKTLTIGPVGKGDMNYTITQIVLAYVESHGKCYASLSDVTGVLNDVKVEFERRVMAPYEDEKIKENGDVY